MEYKIYVAVTQTGTLVARTIKVFTKAPYNHSSISLTKDLSEMYSFCRVFKQSPLPACFNREFVDTVVFGMYKNIPCEIYEISVTKEQRQKIKSIIKYFQKTRRQYHFNLLGFLGIALNIPIHRQRAFTCSQFVAFVLCKSGIIKQDKDIFLFQPDDFRKIPGSVMIYRGNLKDYAYKPYSEIVN